MTKTLAQLLAGLIMLFSILGMIDAAYITWEKASGIIPPCRPPFDCGTVLNSPWATIGPIPLSVVGFGFYSVFLGLGIAHFRSQRFRKIIGLWGAFGAAFSLYLVYIMGVVLEAWCLYCLLSAINCLILFILSMALNSFKSEVEV